MTIVPAWALDPDLPPGSNFDLSHWKLTLPDDNASEMPPAQLVSGSTNASFFTGPDGAMVFRCPVTGGRTIGSDYPRSELRELFDPRNDNVNWTAHGRHTLNAQCKVTEMPSSKKIIIGQIHSFSGNAYPLVKLQFRDGTIEALVKESPNVSTDTRFTFAVVGLDNLVTYRLAVEDGLLSMTVNGVEQSVNVFQTDPAWADQTFYFKAGNYCQDNAGDANEAAVVSFYQLSVTHGTGPGAAPVLTNAVVSASSVFRLSLVGQVGSSYVIQSSPDLINWSDVLTNTATADRIDFTESLAPVTGARFYRARNAN